MKKERNRMKWNEGEKRWTKGKVVRRDSVRDGEREVVVGERWRQ